MADMWTDLTRWEADNNAVVFMVVSTEDIRYSLESYNAFDSECDDYICEVGDVSETIIFDAIADAINEINTPSFQLMQNSPNPANNETSITFNLNRKGICHFELSTVSGKIIYSQNLGIQSAGLNNIHLNTSKLSKGIYFYTLAVENTKQTKKLIIE